MRLQQALIGDSAAAPPAHILEGLPSDLAHQAIQGAPHTIYQELWHIAFWQQVTLDWVNGIETPFPARPSDGFPADRERAVGSAMPAFLIRLISRLPTWRVTRRDSNNPSAVHRGRAIPSASCRSGNSWRAWRPTMLITSAASSCFASSLERGLRPPEASAGDLRCILREPLWQFA